MRKKKTYRNIRFDSKALFDAEKAFRSIAPKTIKGHIFTVASDDAVWEFNTFEEFLAAVDSGTQSQYSAWNDAMTFWLDVGTSWLYVSASTREEIESVFAVFETHVERCSVPAPPKPPKVEPRIFIGHGQNSQWRDLKDHLHEKHGYAIQAYEIGARAGFTIKEVLEDMLDESSFALLVMTGEDETKDGLLRARQNVVHEAGLFQGRLGFPRAVILLEEGTEELSNIYGLQQIRFSKGRIKESLGEVLAVLKREIG